jgi:site-specific DNA recombinase
LRGKREALLKEVQRVYQLYVDGKLDGDGFSQFHKPLQERQRQLDEEVPRLQAEVDLLKVDHLSADSVFEEAEDLYSRWPSLSRDEKQRVAETITEKIIIGKDEVTINLCSLPSSEKLTKEQRKLAADRSCIRRSAHSRAVCWRGLHIRRRL